MSARDELAKLLGDHYGTSAGKDDYLWSMADIIIERGYRKPRTITTAEGLEKLPFGSAVQTSDDSDTVVLKAEGALFRNQSGADLSATVLWRYGTHPFTLIYAPEPSDG